MTSLNFAVLDLSSGNGTSSSNTHMRTSLLQNGNLAALRPRTVAMADPQLPEPMIQICSFSIAIAIGDVIVFVSSPLLDDGDDTSLEDAFASEMVNAMKTIMLNSVIWYAIACVLRVE